MPWPSTTVFYTAHAETPPLPAAVLSRCAYSGMMPTIPSAPALPRRHFQITTWNKVNACATTGSPPSTPVHRKGRHLQFRKQHPILFGRKSSGESLPIGQRRGSAPPPHRFYAASIFTNSISNCKSLPANGWFASSVTVASSTSTTVTGMA